MPIQSVFTSKAPAEAPPARPRAGNGDEAFALPETREAAAGAGKDRPAAKAPAAREAANTDPATPQEAKADAGEVAILVAMAAASPKTENDSAGDRGTGDAQTGKAEPAGEAEATATASGAAVAMQALAALLSQAPLAGVAVAGETVDAASAETGAQAAKKAAGPVLAMGPPVGTAAELAQAGAAPAAEGKAGQGDAHTAGPGIPGKAGEQGTAKAAQPAAEARAPDASPPPPAPLDLSGLLQQAPATAGPERLAQAFAPGAAEQGAAGGQPTPVHVVPIEIGLRAMAGVRQFDIRLDPDELGRVDVNLSISDRGEVSAKLTVDRVETLHLLQRDARTLERAFEQAGLKPSDGGIDISLRDPSGQPGFRQSRGQDEAPERPRPADGGEHAEEASLSIDPVPPRRLIRLGGVDLSI